MERLCRLEELTDGDDPGGTAEDMMLCCAEEMPCA